MIVSTALSALVVLAAAGLALADGTNRATKVLTPELAQKMLGGPVEANPNNTKTPAQLNVLKGVNWLIISAGTFSAPDTAKQEQTAKEIIGKVAED